MHREKTGEFLLTLTKQCRNAPENHELFSYLAGFLCHYALDKTAHPYIVYRTGHYDGTEETRKYRGNHTLLERAIDHVYLKEWGKRLASMPITGKILRMKKIPKTISEELDTVYQTVYGWENASRDLTICAKDQRRFYLLVQDPTGLLNRIVGLVDNGKSLQEYFSLSYAGRDQGSLDILNRKKETWHHPCDPEIRSDESFAELFQKACGDAVRFILAAEAFLEDGTADPAAVYGSDSYETGLYWKDSRNIGQKIYDPLPLRGWIKK